MFSSVPPPQRQYCDYSKLLTRWYNYWGEQFILSCESGTLCSFNFRNNTTFKDKSNGSFGICPVFVHWIDAGEQLVIHFPLTNRDTGITRKNDKQNQWWEKTNTVKEIVHRRWTLCFKELACHWKRRIASMQYVESVLCSVNGATIYPTNLCLLTWKVWVWFESKKLGFVQM